MYIINLVSTSMHVLIKSRFYCMNFYTSLILGKKTLALNILGLIGNHKQACFYFRTELSLIPPYNISFTATNCQTVYNLPQTTRTKGTRGWFHVPCSQVPLLMHLIPSWPISSLGSPSTWNKSTTAFLPLISLGSFQTQFKSDGIFILLIRNTWFLQNSPHGMAAILCKNITWSDNQESIHKNDFAFE